MTNLYVVSSQIEKKDSTEKRVSGLVEDLLNSNLEFKLIGYFNKIDELKGVVQEKSNSGKPIIIINSSGGTEALIETIVANFKSPVLILANSQNNSFASSLEAYAYLKEKNAVKVFYSDDNTETVSAANKFYKAVNSLHKINSARFCSIGNPSDWLLTSKDFSGFGKFGTKFTQLKIEELISEVEKIPDENTDKIVNEWKSNFKEVLVADKSLIDSAKVYLALQKIILDNQINVFSIRCFDLLSYNYTACMGLSIFNDEGITAGCEGDIPTTFTMFIAQELAGQAVWMANPSSIDKEKNQIVFAHCSVPASFLASVNESGLTTHMESGLSTAIQGPLHKSEVTVLRISNDFKKIIAVKGKIIDTNMKDINLCRTQAVIKINGEVKKWVETTYGNHHVIAYGDITTELGYFCDFADVELVRT